MKKNGIILKSILLSAILISPVALLASNPNTVLLPTSSYKETKFNRPNDVDWDKNEKQHNLLVMMIEVLQ